MSYKRVCVIGAGPSGMSFMCAMKQAEIDGKSVPEVVCYEKQEDWGGLWNYSWRTGTDAHGEQCHGSMYQNLWSNGPKECLEFPDYTFEDHFKKIVPSYPPREVLFDYLKGYWSRYNIRDKIRFSHAVRHVEYLPNQHVYSVKIFSFEDKTVHQETFTHVIVASGHFSVPHQPDFPGFDKFQGRILHSHDFRSSGEFSGKRLLLIGSSYSAEDISLQCIKYGATSAIITWRTEPMGFKWPSGIEERPLLQKMEGKTAFFKDGSSSEVDVIILCTGYLHSFPFMAENLCLKTDNNLYPDNLYRGIVWTRAGDNQLFYLGMQDQYYTFTFFLMEGIWAREVILGSVKLPSSEEMLTDNKKWVNQMKTCKDSHDDIVFQTDHINQMRKDVNYPHDLDTSAIFFEWHDLKEQDIVTYRDGQHTSIYTNHKAPQPGIAFMSAMGDSLETFLK